MYEVASKRVNIVDCEVDVISNTVLKKPSSNCRELQNINQDTVTRYLSKWSFDNPKATRRELVSNLCEFLNSKGLNAKTGCIPSLLVEGKLPIEIIRYNGQKDFFELLGRMLWIYDQYDSVIGILAGVMNPNEAAEIEDSYKDLFLEEENVVLMLA